MKLTTPVEIKPLDHRLTYKDSILFVGSCFADEMGRRMTDRYFDTLVNPFGVLFNPCSIADCLGLLEEHHINPESCRFKPDDVISTPGGYCSFHHHGSFSRITPEEFLENANRELERSSAFYHREGWVVVTLGTSFVYTDRETGIVVSNCHKLPSCRFERTMIDADRVYDSLSRFVSAHPERQWVFTVSPVRHLADGLHANQLSKATLLLGVERLTDQFPNAHYFPAYEIMLDELRDYRFFADDMMHPSQLAADYVFSRFMDWALADSDKPLLSEAEKIHGMMQHRILNPGTVQAEQFDLQRNNALDSFLGKIGE
jgi:hypothetical protein